MADQATDIQTTDGQAPEVDVAVVGGGPIGLTTFIALRRAGVDAVLVERHAGTAIVPKALLLNERTMEVFRQLGLDDDVRAASLPRADVGFLFHAATLTSAQFQRFPMLHDSGNSGVQSQLCSQDALEPVLRAHAERLAPGRVLFGTRLDAISQDEHGATLLLVEVESGTERVLRSRYVVAADGSRSTVRDLLGIPMEGVASLGHSIHAVFDAPIGPLVADRASAMYYIDDNDLPGQVASGARRPPVLFVVVDGDHRWRLMVEYDPGSGQDFSEQPLRAMIRRAVGVDDLEVEFRGIYPWEPSALLAERFRDRRVFLVGDAAHVRPPWGGLGMNSGIGDAHNLAWKLAEAVAGRAPEGLLDTYELERRPIAQRTIQAAIRNAGQNAQVRATDPAARAANNRRRLAEGLVLGYTYQSPAVISDGTDAPEVQDEHADYAPAARPGHRAPHFWVGRGSTRVSVTDLYGEGFVLLAGPEGAAWRGVAAAVGAQVPTSLRAYVVGGEDADLTDPDARWGELYCPGAAGAVLVRPDGHVAWRSPAVPPDAERVLLTAMRTAVTGAAAQLPTARRPDEDRPVVQRAGRSTDAGVR